MTKQANYTAIYALRDDGDYDLWAVVSAVLVDNNPSYLESFKDDHDAMLLESETLDFPDVYSKYEPNYDMNVSSDNYEIRVSTNRCYGFFEHKRLGEGSAGGLWFEHNELTDYDGVFALPEEVSVALTNAGFGGDILCEPK